MENVIIIVLFFALFNNKIEEKFAFEIKLDYLCTRFCK